MPSFDAVEPGDQHGGPPDLLGDEGRAQLLASRILDLQRQVFEVGAILLTNGHEWDHAVPGLTPPQTYAQRAADLQAGVQRLLDAHPDLYDRVVTLAEERRGAGAD